jgi:hypothetical protein
MDTNWIEEDPVKRETDNKLARAKERVSKFGVERTRN